jgi:hypothetical protein
MSNEQATLFGGLTNNKSMEDTMQKCDDSVGIERCHDQCCLASTTPEHNIQHQGRTESHSVTTQMGLSILPPG